MDGAPLFPVLVKDAAFRPPDGSTYYVLASNGLFLVRRTPLFSASVAVDGGPPGLETHDASLTLHLPRLPRALLERAVGFFRAVYERWQGEAILIVFYAPPAGDQPGRFALGAPPQRIRGRFERGYFRAELRLDYGSCEKPGPEYVKLGTIHSHGNAGPAHSGIDMHDELYESGLHITAGYVHSEVPEFAAAFVVGRTRFTVPVDTVLPRCHRPRRPLPSWMSQVTVASDYGISGRNLWSGAAWEPRHSVPRYDGRRPAR